MSSDPYAPCPKCGNTLQNATPDDSPTKRRCATCKHVWDTTQTVWDRLFFILCDEAAERIMGSRAYGWRKIPEIIATTLEPLILENQKLWAALDQRCQCQFDPEKNREQVEECHLHQCQRSVCKNGDPTDVTLDAKVQELREALSELADLVDAILVGEYKPDSFTTQPARRALAIPK